MTRGERAQQIWQVLTAAAHNRQILTYSILGELIGTGAGTLAPLLGAVMNYCAQNALPPLTILVVNKDTGLPGSGLSTVEELGRDRESVFNLNWYSFVPPSAATLELAAKDAAKGPGEGELPARLGKKESALTELGGELTGARLNREWKVGAVHALYHREGSWYHRLTNFPGALFDPNGYVLFETEADFLRCDYLEIGQHVNVAETIGLIPTYVRVRSRSGSPQS